MKNTLLILFAAACAMLLSCSQEKMTDYAEGGGVEKDQPLPGDPTGSQAGFVLTTQAGSLRSAIGGTEHVFTQNDQIYLRSSLYNPTVDAQGRGRLEVPEASSGSYVMFLYPEGSRYWFSSADEAPLKGLIIPYSQFYGTTAELLSQYPMVAEYKAGQGGAEGTVEFKEMVSAIAITVKGSAKVASVHLQNKATEQLVSKNMAGKASYSENGIYELTEGVNFVNLNCTRDGMGVDITPDGTTFYLVLAPGDYSDGLTLTVTDMDHKGQVFDVAPFQVAAGELKTLDQTYAYSPDADLLFFEHFDNFVWGGNVQGNQAVSSYAPDASSNPNDEPGARTGYEQAFVNVGTTTPGSAFVQANWATVKGWTVGERPAVNTQYIKSRNIGDIIYMYRCQEYQGCISVGGGDETRGGFQPVSTWPVNDTFYDLQLSFDICLRYNTEDKFCTTLSESGIASRLVVDGQEIELNGAIAGNNTYTSTFQNTCSLDREVIKAPVSESYTDGWHHVEMTFANLNELSQLGLWGFDTGTTLNHGAFIDNVEIRKSPRNAAQKPLRVLLYNIQNGMWADQGNDFVNFVAFVKRYDPDICVFCEGQTTWKTGSAVWASVSEYHLFKNRQGAKSGVTGVTTDVLENEQWADLAARWGHSYHATAAYKDHYPQVITSKYPVTTKGRIFSSTDLKGNVINIAHGAGHFQVTVDGQVINIVTIHTWPQKYHSRYSGGPADQQAESAAALEGYDLQRREVEGALLATIGSSKYSDQENWLFMGDMNSISPLDEDYYIATDYTRYINEGTKWMVTHNQVLQKPGGDIDGPLLFGKPIYDMLRQGDGSLYTGPGRFMTSTGGAARLDIMYGSESMRRRVDYFSTTLNDKWCTITSSPIYNPDGDEKHPKIPSDHRPVLVEFDMSK